MDDIRECYRILDLEPGASLEEIKRAYRELVKVWHPDRFRSDPKLQAKAGEKLKQINLAYERLCEEAQEASVSPADDRPRAEAGAGHDDQGRNATPDAGPVAPAPAASEVKWKFWTHLTMWASVVVAVILLAIAFAVSARRRESARHANSKTIAAEAGNKLEDGAEISGDELWQKAEGGEAGVGYKLGLINAAGKGGTRDLVTVRDYILKSAEQGYAEAQVSVGEMYEDGRGVPKNEAKALDWYLKAATQGDAGAQLKLSGWLLLKCPKDETKAFELCLKFAKVGNPTAQSMLGSMFRDGTGIPKDDAKAVEWYQKAAAQGYPVAQFNLGSMYAFGTGVPKDDAKAVEWYQKAATQGDADAQNNLGAMYSDGRGVPKDEAKAVEWFQKAAAQGDAGGQCNLGFMYSKGRGVPKDDAKAVELFQKAANQGNAQAQLNLGIMYAFGEGRPKDDVRAYAWISLAVANGKKNGADERNKIEKGMTPERIAEAQKLSAELFAKMPKK
jgi:TPR repeat protein